MRHGGFPERDGPPIVAVLGGTGFLGREVVAAVIAQGCRARIVARHLPEAPQQAPAEADIFLTDIRDGAGLRAALSGATGVVNAVSLYRETSAVSFEDIHVDAAARAARLSAEQGVAHFIQISGIGSDPHAASDYIRARGEGEQAVRQARPDAVIVRPAVMYGRDSGLLAPLEKLGRLPAAPLFGRGGTRLQPVHVGDVAQAVAALAAAGSEATLYEFAGPRTYTYRELLAAVARAGGHRPPFAFPLPFALWDMLAAMLARVRGAPLTRSQVELMQVDTVANDRLPGLRQLGIDPAPLETFVA